METIKSKAPYTIYLVYEYKSANTDALLPHQARIQQLLWFVDRSASPTDLSRRTPKNHLARRALRQVNQKLLALLVQKYKY
jgi:hypothetical protein